MKNRKLLATLAASLCALIATANATVAGAVEAHHFKAVSFQVREEAKDVTYAPTFDGSFIKLIQSLDKTSEPYVTVHTPHIHPGDIVNLQADVLGKGENDAFEDDGMNCQLSYNTDNGKDFSIAGLCSFFTTGESGEAEKRNVIIPSHEISVSDEENGHWVLLFDDKQSGVAFYAGIEH